MNEELLKILNMLKEDFEMLKDGTWDLNYSDGSEIQAQQIMQKKKNKHSQK